MIGPGHRRSLRDWLRETVPAATGAVLEQGGKHAATAATWLYARTSPSYVLAPWRVLDELRTDLFRTSLRVDALEVWTRTKGPLMATDRELIEKMAATLPTLADAIRSKDAEIASLRQAAGEDESSDAAALSPVADGLDALVRMVTPAAPDVTPVETVEEIPGAVEGVEGTPGPDPVDGASTDAAPVAPGETSPTESPAPAGEPAGGADTVPTDATTDEDGNPV